MKTSSEELTQAMRLQRVWQEESSPPKIFGPHEHNAQHQGIKIASVFDFGWNPDSSPSCTSTLPTMCTVASTTSPPVSSVTRCTEKVLMANSPRSSAPMTWKY